VGGGHNGNGALGIGDSRERNIEAHRNRETPVLGGDQTYFGVDRNSAQIGVISTPHYAERTLEARGIAHGEELLGVGASTIAPHFGRGTEIDFQHLVAGHTVTLFTASYDVGMGCIERFGHVRLLSTNL
jgi:hypothetical protein